MAISASSTLVAHLGDSDSGLGLFGAISDPISPLFLKWRPSSRLPRPSSLGVLAEATDALQSLTADKAERPSDASIQCSSDPCNGLGRAPGWIVSAVGRGPLMPSNALKGVTTRLKCTKRMDKATPDDLLREPADDLLREPVAVAFKLDNYGKRWCLLDERSESE